MRIDMGGSLANLVRSTQRRNTADETTPEALHEGVRVSLSAMGRGMSASPSGHQAVDDSDLPDAIKHAVKMIRELKAQIALKQAELRRLTQSRALDPQAQRLEVEALQASLATLHGALASANANLIRLMHEQGLSPEQMRSAAMLAMG